ncbi:nucleotidyltransferase domain-containing protein [Chromatium okenii]|jgi:predicted nucleotidyltransferase|uniref:Polymerase beta nucleotidyltransferase domain-containing protein n=1 Tax=Chromatium okenii TaxID=61644 RepID=A0A2S7XNG0_9GAMM|nr:nucleotidyltransferase domain-containing protein [Chromatium okenii]PQJ94952.1 hypothetical protein CXB77_17710 [Chromatium okenii]
MEFGLSANVCAVVRTILNQYPAVQKAVIYGSRAKGNYHNGSDIDLTLLGDALDYDTLSAIAWALDDSDIPHTVDLSLFETIENPALREHIHRVGMVFYERE